MTCRSSREMTGMKPPDTSSTGWRPSASTLQMLASAPLLMNTIVFPSDVATAPAPFDATSTGVPTPGTMLTIEG